MKLKFEFSADENCDGSLEITDLLWIFKSANLLLDSVRTEKNGFLHQIGTLYKELKTHLQKYREILFTKIIITLYFAV